MRASTKAVVGISSVLLLGLVIAAVWIYVQVLERPQEAYAVQYTAELLIEYLKTHTNQWPRSWSDLHTTKIGDQDYFRTFENQTGGYKSFLDDLERTVAVDFSVTTAQLRAATQSSSEAPFRVVWLRSGRRTHWVGLEPNELVATYIRTIE
jgi:hypothetical protein